MIFQHFFEEHNHPNWRPRSPKSCPRATLYCFLRAFFHTSIKCEKNIAETKQQKLREFFALIFACFYIFSRCAKMLTKKQFWMTQSCHGPLAKARERPNRERLRRISGRSPKVFDTLGNLEGQNAISDDSFTFWSRLGSILVLFGFVLGCLGPVVGGSGSSWSSLGRGEPVLGVSWGILGPFKAVLVPSGAISGPSWVYLGPSWGPRQPQDSPRQAQDSAKMRPKGPSRA